MQGEQERTQAATQDHPTEAELDHGVGDGRHRGRPDQRTGQRGERPAVDEAPGHPPREDAGQRKETTGDRCQHERALPENGEGAGDDVGLHRPVHLAPVEGREMAVQDLLRHESDDRLVRGHGPVEQQPQPQDDADDQRPGRRGPDDPRRSPHLRDLTLLRPAGAPHGLLAPLWGRRRRREPGVGRGSGQRLRAGLRPERAGAGRPGEP